MVLKIGSDGPVQPWTGLYPDGYVEKPKIQRNEEKLVTSCLISITGNRAGQIGSKTNRDEEHVLWIVDSSQSHAAARWPS